jgi:glycosyltransferase involved in cell wall biosynthesis
MRIGLNLLYLLPGVVGGTETYARGLLGGLSRQKQSIDFVVFINEETSAWPFLSSIGFELIICPIKAIRRPNRYFFEQLSLPRLLKKHNISLVHSLGYVGPLRPHCSSVVTIPDLNSFEIGGTMPPLKRIMLRFYSQQSAKRSDHIITISEFSRKSLIHRFHLDPAKVSVTYLAPPEDVDQSLPEEWERIRHLYGIGEPYIAAFGGGARHKNLGLLLKAFDLLSAKIPHSLVVIGHCPPGSELLHLKSKLQERLLLSGYVPNDHIMPILRHSDLLVFPSFYEGFGLPVIEAQKARIPVVCSNAASLPEIAGSGAIYFDPHSVTGLIKGIQDCLDNVSLKDTLIRAGETNLKRFSWDKTVQETLSIYHQVVGSAKTI